MTKFGRMSESIVKALILTIIGVFVLFFYWKFSTPGYLTFSDGAKMADIARSVVEGRGYGGLFSSFGADKNIMEHLDKVPFPRYDRHPLMPLSMALTFSIIGSNDFAVIITSVFYYLATLVLLYVLGKRLFGNRIGFLACLAFICLSDFWPYALNGASETLFAMEIVLTFLLFSFKTKKAAFIAILVSLMSYFTRPQGFILVSGAVLFYLLTYEKDWKQAVFKFFLIGFAWAVVDIAVLSRLTGNTFFYSVLSKGADTSVLYTADFPGTTGLRTAVDTKEAILNNISNVLKKVFYNMYNLFKLQPSIFSPYIWSLFVVGIFFKTNSAFEKNIKIVTVYLLLVAALSTSISIPFFRYIHPFLPLVYLFAVASLYRITEKFFSGNATRLSFLLIFIFVIAQALGVLFLDSRFLSSTKNLGKKPIYYELAKTLESKSQPNSLTATNLDTWASWYGKRRTVWLPLTPDQIISSDNKIRFNHIYITSYLINDENYSLSEAWRVILENPEDESKWNCAGCGQIALEFDAQEIVVFQPNENYENIEAKAILLTKN